MKKFSTLLFAVLVSATAFGQVSMDLNVIGRADLNPRFTFDGEKPTFNWANTSVYTKLETTFGENLTLMLVNHWAASGEQVYPFGSTPELYKNSWTSNNSTWCDYAYLDYTLNNWSFRLGKDVIAIGGFEYDDWDWDVDYDLASTYWLDNTAYQWGGSIAWTSNDQNTSFRAQAVSSPYSYTAKNPDLARPWVKGLGSYYFQHTGSYGIASMRNAIGFVDAGDSAEKCRMGYFHASVGLQFYLLDDALTLGTDFLNEYGINMGENKFHNFYTAKYESPSEKWEILGKFGWEYYKTAKMLEERGSAFNYFGGVSAAYFPLQGKKDLRLQATVACNPTLDWWNERNTSLSLTIGLVYNLPIHIL